MNEDNLRRVQQDQELAESQGFKLAPTLYPLGNFGNFPITLK